MRKILLICVSSVLLSACLGGRSPDSKFFMLESDANIVVSDKKTSVLVEMISIPDLIYRPQIVLKDKDSAEILISEYNRWAEPLPDVIRQTLTDDLQTYLPNAFIKLAGYTTDKSKYQYILKVEVNHFIGTFNDKAVLDVWWYLKNKNGVTVVREKTRLELPLNDTYQDYVVVQSNLVSELAKQIATKIN